MVQLHLWEGWASLRRESEFFPQHSLFMTEQCNNFHWEKLKIHELNRITVDGDGRIIVTQ